MTAAKQIKVAKITLNMGAGKSTDKLDKGMMLLEKITGAKPVKTLSKKRIAGWGIRPGLPIGCKVTIRGAEAPELLKKLLGALDNVLKDRQFDNEGNLSFGVQEYIDIPGMDYLPEIGVLGFQVCATLERQGFRIKRRRLQKKKIGKHHKVGKDDAIEFMKANFGIKLDGE